MIVAPRLAAANIEITNSGHAGKTSATWSPTSIPRSYRKTAGVSALLYTYP